MSDESNNLPDLAKNEMLIEGFTPQSIYTSGAAFEHIQRVAKVFATSDLVPDVYKSKLGNCIIALEMSMRMDVPALMFMQNSYLVHGKPALDGKFIIALVNQRGPYVGGVQYQYTGTGDSRTCIASGTTKDGRKDSASCDVKTAKEMGWWDKNKLWRSITDQMLAYRSATWLARRHCPELLCGLQPADEVLDVIDVEPSPIQSINSKLKGN